MGGWSSYGALDQRAYTTILNMDSQQGPTVQQRGLCSVLCGSLDGRRVWGRMDTRICVTESVCCAPETTKALLNAGI